MPTNFGPCCENCAAASCDERSRAAKTRTDARNNLNDPASQIRPTRDVIGVALLSGHTRKEGTLTHVPMGRSHLKGYTFSLRARKGVTGAAGRGARPFRAG
jgi:hypothetical protein